MRQAFGQGSGAILSYHRILSHWDRRIHHCHIHDEHCWPICRSVSPLLERLDDIDRLLRCGICRFLMAQSYAGFVCQYAWISNSFPRPPSKRAVALALINAFSQLGNIGGSCVVLVEGKWNCADYDADMYGLLGGDPRSGTHTALQLRPVDWLLRCCMGLRCIYWA